MVYVLFTRLFSVFAGRLRQYGAETEFKPQGAIDG